MQICLFFWTPKIWRAFASVMSNTTDQRKWQFGHSERKYLHLPSNDRQPKLVMKMHLHAFDGRVALYQDQLDFLAGSRTVKKLG